MEDTKKIGLFRALFNVGGAMTNLDESTNNTISWDGLRQRDFEEAGVNKDEQRELGSSLEKIKLFVSKFFEKVKKTVSQLKGSSKVNNMSSGNGKKQINGQHIKMEENDQKDQEKEMFE